MPSAVPCYRPTNGRPAGGSLPGGLQLSGALLRFAPVETLRPHDRGQCPLLVTLSGQGKRRYPGMAGTTTCPGSRLARGVRGQGARARAIIGAHLERSRWCSMLARRDKYSGLIHLRGMPSAMIADGMRPRRVGPEYGHVRQSCGWLRQGAPPATQLLGVPQDPCSISDSVYCPRTQYAAPCFCLGAPLPCPTDGYDPASVPVPGPPDRGPSVGQSVSQFCALTQSIFCDRIRLGSRGGSPLLRYDTVTRSECKQTRY